MGQLRTKYGNFTINKFRKQVSVRGYQIELQIDQVAETDTTFRFEFGNIMGSINCTIHLKIKGKVVMKYSMVSFRNKC